MSISDTISIENHVDELVAEFRDEMIQLFDEMPDIFEGRNTKLGWHAECKSASIELVEELNKAIEKIEARLHNGEYA
jgi:hypothetical protein